MSHPDLDYVRTYFTSIERIQPRVVANACASTLELSTLLVQLRDLIACEQHLGHHDRQARDLRLTVDAGLALFRCAATTGSPVTYRLGEETVTRRTEITKSEAHVGSSGPR